ncbi:MAG: magnesium transporter [Gammaproteobacteria bacterium]|jgi:magnesium transporter|nr:magnesium transporter [Gammaproteobacteria bacterium]MBT4494287.1 magnesium transporter [Gammaproteobacteria bacterium]MBT7372090.1 magnesium transporter [Gammaproteobacteria bacterium]
METEEDNKSSPFSELGELVQAGTYPDIQRLMNELKPEDLADVLESSPPTQRTVLWNLCDEEQQSEILQHIDEDLAPSLLGDKSVEEIAQVLENIHDDDITDILQQLPATLTRQVLQAMDDQDRNRVENLLSYPEDTAAGLMDTDTISVRAQVTIDVVLRYLRRHPELPPTTDKIFVVNTNDEFAGQITLTTLLVSDPSLTVSELMITEEETIPADMSAHDVAAIFERYDLVSAPVLDDNNRLLGRITIDDVVDVIIEEADHSILGMAGLTETEDQFAPILQTARSRAVWLGANLITAFIAASVIDIFKETIEKVVALAVLMPIVASMGGVAGSQTLTLVIRNMAQSELFESNLAWLTRREVAVGTINGCLWALVVAAAASVFFQDYHLGLIIAAALVINLVVAALAGALLPSFLRSIGIDPAIAGTVVLTTITDVVGFLSFLGLATWFYA